MTDENAAVYRWLSFQPLPRPLVWQPSIFRRRLWYGFLCLLLLAVAVGTPLLYGLKHMTEDPTADTLKPTQIALYLGAMIVVSYVMFVHSLFKQYDDVKWLGQRGLVAEANIFAVFRSSRKVFVGYRFWDDHGHEREREAIIDLDSGHPLPELVPGMVVPLLFDPHKPEHRNYLWLEASHYLIERPGADPREEIPQGG